MALARELSAVLISRAAEDEDFRRRLISDPKRVIEEETRRISSQAMEIPANIRVVIHEDGPNVVNIVLPPKLVEKDDLWSVGRVAAQSSSKTICGICGTSCSGCGRTCVH